LNPGNKSAQEKFDKLLKAMQDAIMRVTSESINSTQTRMIDNVKTVDQMLDRIMAAVRAGNDKEALELLAAIKGPLDLQIQMAKNFAEKLEDPNRKKQIFDACDSIKDWYKKLDKSVRFALDNPKDPNAQKDLEKVIQGTKDAVSKIVALTYDDPEQRIIQNSSELNADLDKLVKAAKEG